MKFPYALTCLSLFSFASLSQAQWKDIVPLERGGESTVVTDGTGHVYVTCHGPSKLLLSSDWGKSFSLAKQFTDNAGGDMLVMAMPNGHVNVTYLAGSTTGGFLGGVANWYSWDFGATLTRGVGPVGELDREWMITQPSGSLFMIYSNGYIGGPKSKGVFITKSTDGGKTFVGATRVDDEPTGSYAVDPFLTQSSDGRIYALWEVTSDYNTIDSIRFAYSTDGGNTFTGHKTLATFPKTVDGQKVDTQERWILASIAASGPKSLVVTYPGYQNIMVAGKPRMSFVEHVTYSEDGGATFSQGQDLLSKKELEAAAASFYKNKSKDENYPYYIQVLPWSTPDPKGGFHIAFTDNRLGQGSIKDHSYGKWAVRMVHTRSPRRGFSASEQVSEAYVAKRCPMDFISCAADNQYIYVSYTDANGSTSDFAFSGKLFLARRENR